MGDESRRWLTGWGRASWSASRVVRARDPAAVAEAVASAHRGGLLARGAGRSYGDAGLNDGGAVLEQLPSRPPRLDPVTGLLTAGAGATFADLLDYCVPRGWILPALPGTRVVTLGGAVAADVHGKNQRHDGSIGRWLTAVEMIDGCGQRRQVAPDTDSAAFWATVGGMGLTGIVTEATLRLLPIRTSSLRVHRERHRSLADVLAAMDEPRPQRYCVAWLDCLGPDPWPGRGVVEWADSADVDELPADQREAPLRYTTPSRPTAVAVPPLPVRIASASALRGYNTMRWWRTPRASDRIVPLAEYFHQLDAIAGWNRLYGPHGFVQYHFLVPPGQAALMRLVVERLRRAGCAPLLAVLKRHGPGDAAPLSFVSDGWSLALDMPADCPALTETLLALDELVAAAGGRVYLAKDAAMRPGTLPAMYPRLAEWRAERDRLDPLARFGSDLGRRLGLSD